MTENDSGAIHCPASVVIQGDAIVVKTGDGSESSPGFDRRQKEGRDKRIWGLSSLLTPHLTTTLPT